MPLCTAQLNLISIVDFDDLKGAIKIIEQSFIALPMASLLCHATYNVGWSVSDLDERVMCSQKCQL